MLVIQKILKIKNVDLDKPNYFDKILNKYFFWIIPESVRPNHLTFFRYLTVPVIFYLLFFHYYVAGLILFSISAFTDALDGAIARVRKMITFWGKVHDPLADKLLIAVTGSIVIVRYLSLEIFLVIILLEIITIAAAVFLYDRKNDSGAQLPGKIKMVFQSIGLFFLLLYTINSAPFLLTLSLFSFIISIFFSFINFLFCIFLVKAL